MNNNTVNINVNNNNEKYVTDEEHHKYICMKYFDRAITTKHCRGKNIVKCIVVVPYDLGKIGLQVIESIAMSLCYIV